MPPAPMSLLVARKCLFAFCPLDFSSAKNGRLRGQFSNKVICLQCMERAAWKEDWVIFRVWSKSVRVSPSPVSPLQCFLGSVDLTRLCGNLDNNKTEEGTQLAEISKLGAQLIESQ